LLHLGGREAGQGRRSRKAKAKAAQAPQEKSSQNGQQEQQALEFFFHTGPCIYTPNTSRRLFWKAQHNHYKQPNQWRYVFFAPVYWGF